MVLLEEFKRQLPNKMKAFINEKQVETLQDASNLADEYTLIHGTAYVSGEENPALYTNTRSHRYPRFNGPADGASIPFCNYCRKRGHVAYNCFKLKDRQQLPVNPEARPCLNVSCTKTPVTVKGLDMDPVSVFEPFIQRGFVSLKKDLSDAIPVRILRDTGSAQSIILEHKLPFSNESYSGSNVRVRGVHTVPGECHSLPLHHVYLSSSHVTGLVALGIQASLPVDGVDLILGNDLAGDKVLVNPVMSDEPSVHQEPEPIESEIPHLLPACVTSSMRNQVPDGDKPRADNNEKDISKTCLLDLPESAVCCDPADFSEQQQSDPELTASFKDVEIKDEAVAEPGCFYTNNKIPMKKRYGQNSVHRTFQPGQQVLVVLSIPSSPLQAQFSGPYIIERLVGAFNYIVIKPGRRKKKQLWHVNILKIYEDRKTLPAHPVNTIAKECIH